MVEAGVGHAHRVSVRVAQDRSGLPGNNAADSCQREPQIGGQGLDFADALHLASSIGSAQRFGTFDAKMARRARTITPIDIAVI